MEDNFLKDDFEQFLKGSADEFLMVPQRKVWHSIYNSMHPDRKWPSLAVCLLILSAVLFIGISNNNSISDAARRANAENMNIAAEHKDADSRLASAQINTSSRNNNSGATASSVTDNIAADNEPASTDQAQLAASLRLPLIAENTGTILFSVAQPKDNNNYSNSISPAAGNGNAAVSSVADIASQPNHGTVPSASRANTAAAPDVDNDLQPEGKADVASASVNADLPAEKNAAVLNNKKNPELTNPAKIAVLTNDQKAWIEDFAFYNRAGKSKFKRNASISYYVTPSLGYRTIIRKNGYTPAGSLVRESRSVPSLHESLFDGVALNLETGVAVNYSIAKKIRLKSGLQFNYTNYITTGTELIHPAQASVAIMSNAPQMIRSSSFSVDGDKDRFNHRSLQVSIPVGIDAELAGSGKIKWYAGATIQPTYIIGGKSLVLSADEKNLITENTLRRNWNLNMGVETFISYKTRSGVVFNAGPQFRYQMLSTFKKQYAYNERPYNLGIKLGITKGF